MGLIRPNRERRSLTDPVAEMWAARRGSFGETVTPERALQLAAVWSCYRILAGIGSTLPLDQYRGDAEVARDPLLDEPFPGQPLPDWLHRLWVSLLSTGNAYGWCSGPLRGPGARTPSQVELLPTGAVKWEKDRSKRWTAKVDGTAEKLWPHGQLWHLPLFTVAGRPEGLSPIGQAAATIHSGLSAQEFGNRWFDDGGHPSAILYSEDPNLDATGARKIKAAFQEATRGTREPAVLGSGLRYERIQLAPNESQFLDSMQWSSAQIAAAIGVPAEWIGSAVSGQNVTYGNREQLWSDWTARDFAPYLVRIETGIGQLLPRGERVRHNLDAILRADLAARYASYEVAARIFDATGVPLLTNDEMRRLENLPPLAGDTTFTRRTTKPTTTEAP